MIRNLVALTLILFSANAFADAPKYIPNFNNEAPTSSIETLVLGRSCYSMSAGALGLTCNPAHLAEEEKRLFRINLNFDSNARNVLDYAADLRSDDGAAVTRRAENQFEPLVSRASGNIWYQHDWWAIKWTPTRLNAAILARNRAYQEISTHLARETELMGQAGFFLDGDENFEVGFQTRYVRSSILRNHFAVVDVPGDPSLVDIDKSKVLYFEPGIAYLVKNDWRPRFSAMLTNVELYRDGGQGTENIVDLGFSTTPAFWSGKISNSISYSSRSDIDRITDRFSAATSVAFTDKLAVQVGLGPLSQAVAVTGRIDSVVLGLGFKSEDVAPESWKSNIVHQILFESGLAF